jgi:glutamate-1-semialdehyde aminotransferase
MALSFARSTATFERAKTLIPGGVQASRLPIYPGESPVYIQRGKGARCWDIDGNEFIDYTLGLGPIILGYAYPAVDDAVARTLAEGVCFTFNHPLQNELAETILRLVPCAEMATFFKTGSDACTAAIRIARAYTGRERIARCGYHGWHDWAVLAYDGLDTAGIPAALRPYSVAFDANVPSTLQALLAAPEAYAAVIVAPEEIHQDHAARLAEIARLARAHGAVFILDEVKTGFRLALGGAQQLFGVTPDLCTLSKAIANGFPLAAVAGRRAIMEATQHVWVSSTFNGEILSMSAALATIGELQQDGALAHIWRMGERLLAGLDDVIARSGVAAETVRIPAPPMPFLRFTDANGERRNRQKHAFYTAALDGGVLFHPDHVWFLSKSHGEAEIDRTLEVCEAAMEAAVARQQIAGTLLR